MILSRVTILTFKLPRKVPGSHISPISHLIKLQFKSRTRVTGIRCMLEKKKMLLLREVNSSRPKIMKTTLTVSLKVKILLDLKMKKTSLSNKFKSKKIKNTFS